jgi:hypothetical protein
VPTPTIHVTICWWIINSLIISVALIPLSIAGLLITLRHSRHALEKKVPSVNIPFCSRLGLKTILNRVLDCYESIGRIWFPWHFEPLWAKVDVRKRCGTKWQKPPICCGTTSLVT